MSINYSEILTNKHNEFKQIANSYERVTKEISYIESVIPEFFSNRGEASSIKAMYESIGKEKESPLFNKTVPYVDINKGAHIYTEYVDGMIEFINDIEEINESTKINSYEDKFMVARDRDSIFIESLYGGNLNKRVETTVTEATSNIEFLIDFIPELRTIQEKCDKIYEESKKETSEVKGKLLKESADMLFESVSNYCFNTVKNIFECYDDIQCALAEKPIKSKEEFVLFI